jgi:hypothetical protein
MGSCFSLPYRNPSGKPLHNPPQHFAAAENKDTGADGKYDPAAAGRASAATGRLAGGMGYQMAASGGYNI